MQYAVSFSDIMDTYANSPSLKQDAFFIEALTGLINAEVSKGAIFERVIYVSGRPTIVIFDAPNGRPEGSIPQAMPKVKRPVVRTPATQP